MDLRRFQVREDKTLLVGDVLGDTTDLSLLMLHGAGKADRSRFSPLRKKLWTKGISSLAFDFMGCGESTGDRRISSLENQTKQACRVVKSQKFKEPLSVIGASMGAYIAVKLLAHFPVDNLILFVPAMYSIDACKLPFNNGFTQTIQKPSSWINSDAWKLLSMFTGNLVLVIAQKDVVIPTDVIERINHAAANANSKTIITIPGAPHGILDFLANDSHGYMSRVMKTIVPLMDKKSTRPMQAQGIYRTRKLYSI